MKKCLVVGLLLVLGNITLIRAAPSPKSGPVRYGAIDTLSVRAIDTLSVRGAPRSAFWSIGRQLINLRFILVP